MPRRMRSLGLAFLAGVSISDSAQAQDSPSGQMTIVVPFAAGGGVDTIARIVAEDLRAKWNVPVLVENLPGGSGMIAGQTLTNAEPDGQTLMLATAGELAVNTTLLSERLTYDVSEDFAPVALAAMIPNVFVVNPSAPYDDVAGFLAAVRENPGTMTYGSSGVGNPQHLTGELFAHQAGVELVHVPYRGSSQQVLDTMGGSIDGTFASAAAVLGNVRDGTLKAIGVTSKEPLELLPDVPPINATEGLEGFELVNWFGFVTKAGVPEEKLDALHAAIEESLASEATSTRLEAIGAQFVPMSRTDFGTFIETETRTFGQIIETANIQPE